LRPRHLKAAGGSFCFCEVICFVAKFQEIYLTRSSEVMAMLAMLVSSSALAYGPHSAAVAPRPALRTSSASRAFAHMKVVEEDNYPTMEELAKEAGMSVAEYEKSMGFDQAMTEEEYQSEQVQAEMSAGAKKVINNMRSASGVEFAPWMKVDAEAIAKAKMERAERKIRSATTKKSDTMLIDPQAAELGAGGGLKSKVLSEEEVELRWSTQDEVGNAGFIVQRRKGGQPEFADIASYKSFSPLKTKGVAGGEYVFLDDAVSPGTWVYRILDCNTNGERSAVCQKLVEIDSKSETSQTVLVGVLIAGLALALVVGGVLSDPIQTTAEGRAASFF
jgi:hypothetical protein